ncbi:assimilatory sulfite reductase (NADPH) flavoprotein subunit [Thiolinea disciformis]|uniref:assimilatory sulfite reductase (NADPH) flavoprotein subunit n=1 Tax=Thiolinea disciformis TaxID=125614 RepID=UPI0003679B5B|nr:assimilatory sulfite reductase (NADPH) flavoprotein subunit [Thiolinea disciformis]
MSLLSAQQFERISAAVNDLTPSQLAWVGGYLSGLSLGPHNVIPFPQLAAANRVEAVAQLSVNTTILYGSQTGNSKAIAEKLHQAFKASGLASSLKSLRDYRPQHLKKEQRVVFVVSTHGNGEPPDDARTFFQFINNERAPQLKELHYAVLALGDSSYDAFCQSGVELDQRLEKLGATRWLARIDCDVDFADHATRWREQILEKVKQDDHSDSSPLPKQGLVQAVQQATIGSAEAPWTAELLSATPVTDPSSEKEVFHFEFSLENSGITYEPGDILAVKVSNETALVDLLIQQGGWDSNSAVSVKGNVRPLREALIDTFEITNVTRKQLQNYASTTQQTALAAQAADKAALVDWLYAADWLDVLKTYPAELSAQAFIDLLRPLQAREYSIASSLAAHPDEVHLLVKRVTYQHHEREHLGVGSNWLARLQAGDSAQIYIKPNQHFKLPKSDNTKLIMIGAGTGVAPFRGFLFEREARGLTGNTWLFFGEQRFRSDFLYQAEWLELVKSGVLERMSVAFSRDQAEKIYVQHRLIEQGAELWQWLQDGAHLYVCGDMHKMAKDVHAALAQIAVTHGGLSDEQAQQYLETLMSERRYQRDVY